MFLLWNEVAIRDKLTKAPLAVLSKYKDINKNVAKSIKSRGFDKWALLVFGSIEGINDLHAEDVIYHQTCYSSFKANRKIPSKYRQEQNNEQITIPDLIKKMADLAAVKEHEG